MEIGDWTATRQLNGLYRQIREMGLETNLAELDAFGFTIIEPGRAAPVGWVERLRNKLLEVAERRTGVEHDIETGVHGTLDNIQPRTKHQYILHYLLYEDPIFQEAVLNPYVLALQTYMLGFDCRLSSLTSIVKWAESDGYGPSLGLHADTYVKHSMVIGKDAHTGNSAWLLTDYTKENGALCVVPGSHRHCRHPNTALLEGINEAVPIEAPAGSLVVWNGNLWHGGFPRTNPGLRLVLTMYFNRSYLQGQEDYRSTVTQEILERNPKRLAALIGLGSPLGWTTEVGADYVSAARVLAEAAEEARQPVPGLQVIN